MSKVLSRTSFSLTLGVLLVSLVTAAFAQEATTFTPGNLVVSVEGCGVNGGTCTTVPNGTGNGTGNSSVGGYGDNQAAPFTLFQYVPTGTSSVAYVNSLVLPQSASGANVAVSGEYGSSSEGTLQLSGNGEYLTIMGYGIDALSFNANPNTYSASPNSALGQSESLSGQSFTAVPRVVALIDAYGNVNSSTAIFNIFNANNPRSVFTADGINIYVSGQGTSGDATGGTFYTTLGSSSATSITGTDAGNGAAQDTRDVQIYNNTLYVSMDSKSGSYNRSYIGTLGSPPATSVFSCTGVGAGCPSGDGTIGPALMKGFGNTGGTGREQLNAAQANGISPAGDYINLSPENYFFASPTVLYVADSGSPKNTSADNETTYTLCGAGGLQKWVNVSGTWTWEYTLYQGLNLVENSTCNPSNTSGTTGLIGLAGVVNGSNVELYATNYTISDLDPTYLYGITDSLTATTNPGETFTLLATAPPDSNFKGVAFAPALPAGAATITSSPSGLTFTSAGTGCAPGTYTTPVTLTWTPGNNCELTVATPQSGGTGTQYALSQWQDGTTGATDTVTAPATSAVYTATFTTEYQLTTSATTGGSVSAGGYLASGTNATITATPSAGYYFVNFTGSTTSTNNPLSLLMSAPQTITANFAQQVTPTVTWPMASAISYGQTLASSILSGGSSSVPGTFAFTTPGTAPSAGTAAQSVTFTPTNNSEYTTVTGTVSVTVNQLNASVTPSAASKIFGTADPALTGTLSGFLAGDSVTATYSRTAGETAAGSPYIISATLSPASVLGNYNITYNTAQFTITPAASTITWATPGAITYGTALTGTQLDATASVPGSFVYSPPATTVLTAGMQPLSVTFTPSSSNYSTATSRVTLQVNQAASTITWATPAAISYGTQLGGAQLDATASVPGTFVYSPPAGTVLNGGSQSLQVTFIPNDAVDYTQASDGVTLLVKPIGQTISFSINAPSMAAYGTSFTVAASSTSGLPISYSSSGPCTNSGATYTMTSGIGICTVTAGQPGNSNYTLASPVVQYTDAQRVTPTVSFSGVPASAPYNTSFTLIATSNSSTSAVISTSDAVHCPLSGSSSPTLATILKSTGTCKFTATFPADSFYTGAAPTLTTMATKAPSVVTWAPPAAISYGTALGATQLDASANVEGTFTYTPALNRIENAGNVNLDVTFKPTNTNYANATATVPLQVTQAVTATTITSPSPTVMLNAVGVAATTLDFNVTSYKPTGAVTLTASTGEVCSGVPNLVTGNGSCRLTFTTTGTRTILASYGGDANHTASNSSSQSTQVTVTVNPH